MVAGRVWGMQRRLIYFPGLQPPPPAAAVLPEAQEVAFQTEDGLCLEAWFVPAAPSGAVGSLRRRCVLVLHGNGGDRSGRSLFAQALSQAGHSVLLTDYRGYGGNPGSPSEAGLAADARAARAYLLTRSDINPDSIVYFGESLGAAVAVGLAVEYPPAALVLRSPFTTLADAGRVHYPFLPLGLLLMDHYDSLSRIGSVRCPVLIAAGDGDRIVPVTQSRRLHAAAREPKRYVEIPGVGHDDWELLIGNRLLREILAFLREF
jgi:uncharacterized protein